MTSQVAIQAVLEMFASATWSECAIVLRAHPEGLSDDAVAYIDGAIEQNRDNPTGLHILEELRDFMVDCRSRGKDAVLADRLRKSELPILDLRYHQVVDGGDDAARLRIAQAALLLLVDEADSRERIAWLRRLADTLLRRGPNDDELFDQALATLEELTALADREGRAEDWAWAKHNLATALMLRSDSEL